MQNSSSEQVQGCLYTGHIKLPVGGDRALEEPELSYLGHTARVDIQDVIKVGNFGAPEIG